MAPTSRSSCFLCTIDAAYHSPLHPLTRDSRSHTRSKKPNVFGDGAKGSLQSLSALAGTLSSSKTHAKTLFSAQLLDFILTSSNCNRRAVSFRSPGERTTEATRTIYSARELKRIFGIMFSRPAIADHRSLLDVAFPSHNYSIHNHTPRPPS